MRSTMHFPYAREVTEYHTAKYGAPGQQRAKKQKLTPEQMELKNLKNKEKMCRWRLRNNFDITDYFVTFTYAREARPPDMKIAKKHWRSLTYRLRSEFCKKGYELKWIRNIEVGTKGAWHIHAAINRIPDADLIIRDAWRYGKVNFQIMHEKGEFRDLAAYLTKTPRTDKRLKESNYSTSRNLPIPEAKKKPLKSGSFRKINVPKGYYLDKNSIYEGINPKTGYKYRTYTFLKIRGKPCLIRSHTST
jgi:hypothetical protein